MQEERKQNVGLQYIAALCASLGVMFNGSTFGFTSPVGPLLIDKNESWAITEQESNWTSSSTVQINELEFSWFSSSLGLGAMAGSIFSGYLIFTFGRRGTMLLIALPGIAGWILMAFSKNFTMLLVARLIHGFVNGVVLAVVPTYIGEIASPRIRGKLGSLFGIMTGFGLLYIYIAGALIKDLKLLSLICIPIPILFFCTMFFLPESPEFLIRKGMFGKMEESLKRLNGVDYDIRSEVIALQNMLMNENQRKKSLTEEFSSLKSLSALKPLSIVITLYFFMSFSGAMALLFNLHFIFQAAGSAISADISGIIYVSLNIFGSIISANLIDRAGRRILLITFSLVMTITLGLLGLFFHMRSLDNYWESWLSTYLYWFPLLSLCTFNVSSNIGIGSVPFVLAGEIFRPDLTDISGSISSFSIWLFIFLVTVSFGPLKNVLGNHGVFWLYAGVCFVSVIYSYIFVPETKGKTKEEIALLF